MSAGGRMEPIRPEMFKSIVDIINAGSTLVIAIATVVTTWITRRMLREARDSFELTRRTVELSAKMNQAELVFRETEQNPDGTERFGGEQSQSRTALREYYREVSDIVDEIERMKK